jgi:hypothetical protein
MWWFCYINYESLYRGLPNAEIKIEDNHDGLSIRRADKTLNAVKWC